MISATLPENKIEKFDKKFKEFATDIKKKKLVEAIEEAKRIYEQSNPPINSSKLLISKSNVKNS